MALRSALTRLVFGAIFGMLCIMPASAAGQDPPGGSRSAENLLRVFLDCNECDTQFVMENVAFVDYVRDRTVADIHVLVTTQTTGGGGREWTVAFIGQGRFDRQDRTLTFNTPQIATSDEQRKEFVRVLKIGLVGYAASTPAAPQLDVTWARPKGQSQTRPEDDPWNYWVFRIEGGGFINGEQSSNSHSYRFNTSANRTTDRWKISLSANGNYNENHFTLADDTTIKSLSHSWSVNSLIVKSINAHWSVGGRTSISQSSFSNNDRAISVMPGLEFDVFPYAESTRRILTVRYRAGTDFDRYRELTIFDKLSETVPRHVLEASLGLRQPWGSVNGSANFSQHLNHLDRTRASFEWGADVRLFKGFSFNVFGQYDRIRDQISLRKDTASTEEVLLHLQQLATGYSYFMNFGLSYRFGSIFNNVVNPRFNN